MNKRKIKLIIIGFLLSGLIFGLCRLFWIVVSFFIVYNATASEPIGFYLKQPVKNVLRGDKVIITIPQKYFDIAKQTGYDANGTFLKEIVAVPDDIITINESGISVNNQLLPDSKAITSYKGIKLYPQQLQTFKLRSCEFWTRGNGKGSYDSRYYGVITCDNIENNAKFLF